MRIILAIRFGFSEETEAPFVSAQFFNMNLLFF